MTDVYWNRRRGLWSVREGGRVVRHEPDVALGLVTFVVRPAAVERIQVRRQREVCAWASGLYLPDAEPPPGQAPRVYEPWDPRERGWTRIHFRPFVRFDFHDEAGRTVLECGILGLWADGKAWGWECQYA